ncbi:MAG: MarR family EPS-associated transcriptional regulator [Candidatus Makaraimicrobium thalassicum]|nr:MAG: MarR family EPS-associated transcriptional regulator [Candidatus Omnitrophota bacterium]
MDEYSLKEDIFKVLRVLSSGDNLSQRELSEHLGISLGKTNYLLKSLTQKGFVKIKNFTLRDQKAKKVKYILTKKGIREQLRLTYHWLKIKEKEYFSLKKEIKHVSCAVKSIAEGGDDQEFLL